MMKRFFFIVLLVIGSLVVTSAQGYSGDWRFPVGISHISGVQDVVDQCEDNLKAEYSDVDVSDGWPVGLYFQPYHEFDNGWGVGAGFGPYMLITSDDDDLVSDLPLNASLRYALLPDASMSPYMRAGVSFHLASGDYVDEAEMGLIGALGVEFNRSGIVGFGLEVGVDTGTLKIDDKTTGDSGDTEDFQPIGLSVSIFAVF